MFSELLVQYYLGWLSDKLYQYLVINGNSSHNNPVLRYNLTRYKGLDLRVSM